LFAYRAAQATVPRPSGGEPAYAVVDVETSGFHPPSAEVIEIAIVHIDVSGQITGSWDTLIRPAGTVGATHVHGIDPGMVEDAPSFASIAPALHSLLAGRIVAAHNLPFDGKFLVAEFARAGIAVPEVRDGVCTLSTAKYHIPGPRHQLADCCRHAGIELTHAHMAIGDATATAKLVGYFLECGIALTGRTVKPSSVIPPQREPVEKLMRPRTT
jgi:DNA polymerase III epsilon subunit-like protein